jgi:iodotyrosine deiodinase
VKDDFIPYQAAIPPENGEERAQVFQDLMRQRRSVREFSDTPVPESLIRTLIATAGTAPSGANKQPWRFVAVRDPDVKREIRIAAEKEEHAFYHHRGSPEYLDDLAHLGTNEKKPYLEIAPWLVVVFKQVKDSRTNQDPRTSEQVYYVNESVGIAIGMFLTAAHNAGLATLTHTPNPMRFLGKLLRRPAYERPYLLIPVGYPAEGCMVPNIERKSIEEIMVIDRPAEAADD